jgi:3'-phosphoadenosine 5'-phosphosulfate sulfotransferase (PAPS reductase)/FAD synthetase
MACKGLLPKPDAAIFADTGWETNATYQHLEWLKVEAGRHGISVEVVRNNKESIQACYNWRGQKCISMPIFTVNTCSGKKGMLRRQCTSDYKIVPIKKQIRKMLGLKPRQWAPKDCVEQWIGISTDEAQRAWTANRERMSVFRFPLLHWNPMSRMDCQKWLYNNYNIIVPKSSCIGCPFHSQSEWQNLTDEELKEACSFDEYIRQKGGSYGELFLHRSCMPLSEVDFRTPEERGQQVFDFYKDQKLNIFLNNSSIITQE